MVSIIIPTYKRTFTLKRAIDSCLNQSMKNIEIIVVDDNDPNNEYRRKTEEVMKNYYMNPKIIYVKHECNKKGSAARNTGIDIANGEYITFLDDDDVLDENKITNQVECLKKMGNKYGIVICGVRICDENTKKTMRYIIPKETINPQFDILRLRLGMGTGSNPLFTKDAIKNTGYFDTSFLRQQDTEYVIRVLRNYKLAIIPEIMITKYENGHPNRPNLSKYVEVHQHFLNKFSKDIESYTQKQQNEIYRNNWHQICIVAVDYRKWRLAKEYFKKANTYMKYTSKMRIGIIKHIINNKF